MRLEKGDKKMTAKNEFKELYKRYLLKFYLKTGFISALIALSALLLSSIIFWVLGSKLYWISFIVFAVVLLGAFGLIVATKKPTEKGFYSSLEELDLSQRAITMYEYQDDDSLMARIQRENAKESIKNKNSKGFSYMAPLELIVTTAIIFALAVGCSIASGMAAHKIIPSAAEVINKVVDPEKDDVPEYEVVFEIEGDGYIDGDIFQLVKEGDSSVGVTAVPEEGWYFYSWGHYSEVFDTILTDDMNWSPEDHDPYRQIDGVNKNVTYYAVFKEATKSSKEDDEPSDIPAPNLPQDPKNAPQPQPNDDSDPSEGGGKYEENNQVIDGETYYGDTTFDNAYNEAMEQMQGEEGNDEEANKIIGDYYETIEK